MPIFIEIGGPQPHDGAKKVRRSYGGDVEERRAWERRRLQLKMDRARIFLKCGVYSFREVTLETLMGKHPREVLPWLSSPYSLMNMKLIHVLDSRLTLPTSQLVALNIVHVATTTFAFLNPQPKFRAMMKDVAF
ncbi:hypothetical protein Godav_014829 [Gossypium davidsonii]|uniref:non-specific serine/threonine protein kinase n=2 Tax=Gossypium TaxID=3633 RepID=A0A7J8RL03_GOSDV|nr:hypothetical protein [Gossypium davidsonii]MBA0649791.1 hypothetical protein [Gossypium klotzschianum]